MRNVSRTHDLPIGWTVQPLGELCHLVNGRAFKPSDWSPKGIQIIRIQNLNDPTKPYNRYDGTFDSKHHVQRGDVLLSWSGTPGTSFGCFIWNREPGVLNQHIFKVHVNTTVCTPEYFVLAVNSQLDEMIEQAHGAVGLRHITKTKLEQLAIPVAPRPQQARITARVHECLMRIVEIGTLSQQITKEASAVRAAAVAAVFKEISSKSPMVTVASVTASSSYGTNEKCVSTPNGTPVLRIPNVGDGVMNYEDLKYAKLAETGLKKTLLRKGDILVVRTNGSPDLVGRCAVFQDNAEFSFASYLIRFRLTEACLPEYLAAFLGSVEGRDAIRRIMRTSAGQYNINSENLRNISFPCPPPDVQRKVIGKINAITEMTRQIIRERPADNNEVRRVRKAILRQAFVGEL